MDIKEQAEKQNYILRYITKFERARIVGARALQLSQGAPTLLAVEDSFDFTPYEMAEKEFRARVLPIGISRILPNRKTIHYTLQSLKDKDFINQL